ncbi:MAG TPA: MBL fold metallo-hydrolase [Gemmatimonadaceae bacterium]|nr:MBL fold metallo-hydrolase [Gemmatimonadaceae bacterium]
MAPPVPQLQTRTVGSLNIHAIQAGGLRLDGGAMFGVVPKPLWERQIPADERNRIPLGMRCLLVDHPSGLVLIDTGLGNKENEKFVEIYGVENAGRGGRTALEDGLASLGIRPEDITLVINTHLHFDHGGGNTFRDESGVIRPAFPKARYLVQRGEFDYATHTNERTAASYFAPNFVPLRDAGVLDLIEGEREIVEGIRVIASPGHVPFHQSVVIESGGETAIFLADVMPTAAHVPLPWIMGYDVEPLVTLESKRRILAQAAEREWLMIFEHDASVAWGRVGHDGKGYRLATSSPP